MQNGDQISLQGITIYGQNGEKAGIKYACQEYEFASVTPHLHFFNYELVIVFMFSQIRLALKSVTLRNRRALAKFAVTVLERLQLSIKCKQNEAKTPENSFTHTM